MHWHSVHFFHICSTHTCLEVIYPGNMTLDGPQLWSQSSMLLNLPMSECLVLWRWETDVQVKECPQCLPLLSELNNTTSANVTKHLQWRISEIANHKKSTIYAWFSDARILKKCVFLQLGHKWSRQTISRWQ